MKNLVLILLIVLLAGTANAQFFDNTLVKTRPMKLFFNPNIGFEKPLGSILSITSEIAYRKFNCFFDGSLDGNIYTFNEPFMDDVSKVRFNGFEMAVGVRAYLITVPTKYLEGYYWIAPFGLYYEAIVDYGHSWAKDVQIYDNGRSVYEGVNRPYYRSDVRLDDLSLMLLIGYQSNIKNIISLDFNMGARYFCVSRDKRTVVSVNPTYDDVSVADVIKENNRRWRFAGRITLGYYIRYDWMEHKLWERKKK